MVRDTRNLLFFNYQNRQPDWNEASSLKRRLEKGALTPVGYHCRLAQQKSLF